MNAKTTREMAMLRPTAKIEVRPDHDCKSLEIYVDVMWEGEPLDRPSTGGFGFARTPHNLTLARLDRTDPQRLRQICTNGATMMLGMEAHSFRHTASVTEASSAVIVAVSDSNARFAKVGERAGLYAATKFTAAQMRRVAEAMYPSTSDDPSSRLVSIREDLVKLFSNGRGNHGQNAWDALNAVTEWDSHHRNVRGSNKELSRLKATFLGLGHAARGIEAVNEIAGIAA